MDGIIYLGWVLAGIGVLLMLAGSIWGIVAGFKHGAMWGIAMLAGFIFGFQLIVWAIFAVKHLEDSYPSLLTWLGGFVPLIVGVAIVLLELVVTVAST